MIAIVSALAIIVIYAQIGQFSPIWAFTDCLRHTINWLPSGWNSSFLSSTKSLDKRPDLLAALMLSSFKMHPTMSLRPARFADLFTEPCQMALSVFFWNLVLTKGLIAALISRLNLLVRRIGNMPRRTRPPSDQ